MEFDNKLKYLALVVVIAILIAMPLIYLTMDPFEEDTEDGLVTVAGEEMSLEELKEMETVEGEARFQNRFYNWNEKAEYEGVALSTLVPNMERSDVLEVKDSDPDDPYVQRFSYRQIFPCDTNREIQGEIILAYSKDGVTVPEWERGPMIAVLPPDGDFSNEILNMTRSLDSRFDTQNSAGSLWVYDVDEITVNEDVYSDTEYLFSLSYSEYEDYLEEGPINEELIEAFDNEGYDINDEAELSEEDYRWRIIEEGSETFTIRRDEDELNIYDAERLTLEGTTVQDYSFEELRNMDSIEGEGKRIRSTASISGPNTYRGVYLTDLVSNVYSGTNYTLEVEARDEYTMTYPREHVEGDVPVMDEDYNETDIEPDFEAILAYEEDGEQVPDWERGPRIAFLNDEGLLSSAGLWAKMVRYIRVLPEQEDWTLELEKGSETVDISKQYFESTASCDYHRAEYEVEDDVYAGVPLWEIVAAVDGADPPDGHYMYNTVLSELGYNVTVEAEDGFSADFPSQQVARNDSIILANELNGEPLPEDEAPLRIVGEGLSGKQSVRNIARIELTELPDEDEIPDWSLTLNGSIEREYSAEVFGALVGCGVHTESFESEDGTYEGIPLYTLVGAVDDGETRSHWSLNDTLVEEGYEVEVIAEDDDYSYTFDIEDVAYNESMIVASRLDGEPLPEDEYPLRLVGEDLGSGMSVKNIAEIRLHGIEL